MTPHPQSTFPQLNDLPRQNEVEMAAFRAIDACADVATDIGRDMGAEAIAARIASALRTRALAWLGERTSAMRKTAL